MVTGPVFMPRGIVVGIEIRQRKTANTLKSSAVHLTLHSDCARTLSVAAWISASHPPIFLADCTLKRKQ